jgi:hypothetical protein
MSRESDLLSAWVHLIIVTLACLAGVIIAMCRGSEWGT